MTKLIFNAIFTGAMPTPIHFTQKSIDFITKASRQKRPEWLDKNRAEYEDLLVNPMRALVEHQARALKSEAPGYRFPTRSFARIRRNIARDPGSAPFRNWVAVSISRDSESLYDSLPNLYFELNAEDLLSAGGLYVPSADQTKHIRRWIAEDPSALEALLEDKDFKKIYKGLGDERVLKTKPRDYPIDHPKIEWLRLSAWYVWRPFSKKVVFSKHFNEVLTGDWMQVLRLNRILERYISTWPKANVTDVLPEAPRREMDW